ncbi:hypothetical protein N018_12680 [Pseudomonas syringae CC1557]|uniref:Lipoprotein n=1 Tax=Pseudomonas syringae CC1557 TaxID=1357279 RepID=W0MUZ9_PSESX|nr:hypothetical protein [Pseudomonas syringae]AHG41030.1 hypothetical protein N018_12680 [Pseudomonas syringae CC1557]
MGTYCQLAKFKGLISAGMITMALTACSSGVGNSIPGLDSLTGDSKYAPEFIKANIIVGKSSKEQIREKFGDPTSVRDNLGDNTAQWVYDSKDSKLGKLADMAYKYTSRYSGAGGSSASSAIIGGQIKAGEAQEVVNDAGTLSGSNTPGKKVKITEIHIDFRGDVVRAFRTY